MEKAYLSHKRQETKKEILLLNKLFIIYSKSMLQNITGNLQSLVTNLFAQEKYKQAINQGQKIYKIQKFKIKSLSPKKILELYYNLKTNFYLNQSPTLSQPWHQNQLKIFIWLIIGYSFIRNKNISEFNIIDWQFFSEILNDKDPKILEYEGLCILNKSFKNRKWESSEIKLFDKILREKYFKNKWNEVAKEIYVLSDKKYLRTGKECRQYWNNHLNPQVTRSSWTHQQDSFLIESVVKYGRKWAKISKILGGKRTQHMIKNRYKSLYNFERKNNLNEDENEEEIMEHLLKKLKDLAQQKQTFQFGESVNQEGEEVISQISQAFQFQYEQVNFTNLVKESEYDVLNIYDIK